MRAIPSLYFFSILTCFILVCTSAAQAQRQYLLDASTRSHRVDAFAGVFIDKTDTLSLDQVSALGKHFNIPGHFKFGFLRDVIWLKLELKNTSPQTSWLAEIPAPFLEYVDFYQFDDDGKLRHAQAGYYRPFNTREIAHTGHAASLIFKKDSTSTLLIRIAGDSPKTFPLLVKEKEYFYEQVRTEDFFYGIFYGILVVMFFYNLFIFLSLRNGNYFLYILTIICTFFIFSSATGYAGKLLWPETPMLNFYAGRLTLPVQGVVMSLFTMRFLELKEYSKQMYYVVASLIPLSVVAAILVSTGLLSSAGNNLLSIATVVYMSSGIVCKMNGNKTANYFIAAWTVYLIGGLLLTLRNSGFFEFNFWTTHLVEIGAALETIIIAFALADKYRRLRKEKEDAQLLALQLQQEITEQLEQKVAERTEELSRANLDLQRTLEKNIEQTRIIEEKNAELDSFFYRISHDLKGPISSLRGLGILARMDVKEEVALNYVDRQLQQVDRLHLIINGLINLTKLNRADLEKVEIDFDKLVDECIQSCQTMPGYGKIRFDKNIEDGIRFTSEWTLLNAILQNLIENAVKYSTEESPYVSIRISKEQDHLVIKVQDNGQGIPAEQQPRIFDMFYRATHNASGTGLGLYIMKRSVDRLAGTIEMTSTEGSGSTFIVRLPVL
jgi:signal transduction histidine kinase